MGKTGCYRFVYLHFWLFFPLFHGFAESRIKCSYLMLSMITKLLSAQPCQSGCSRKGQCWPVMMPPAFLAPADKTVQLCSELAQKIDPLFPETSPQHRFFFSISWSSSLLLPLMPTLHYLHIAICRGNGDLPFGSDAGCSALGISFSKSELWGTPACWTTVWTQLWSWFRFRKRNLSLARQKTPVWIYWPARSPAVGGSDGTAGSSAQQWAAGKCPVKGRAHVSFAAGAWGTGLHHTCTGNSGLLVTEQQLSCSQQKMRLGGQGEAGRCLVKEMISSLSSLHFHVPSL